jgi:trehalose 6-phosphate phosphatase
LRAFRGIDPEGILLGLDFDGTLAPIVPEPAQARADELILGALRELVPRLRAVAVISGRDPDDLARRLPVDGLRLFGNHGLVEWRDGEAVAIPAVSRYLPALARARQAIERLPESHLPGVSLEAKLASLSVHFRNAADPVTVGRTLRQVLAPIVAESGLTLHSARMVWEILPPVLIDKGAVVRRLRDELDPAGIIYVGDDVPDAAAFEALRAMEVGAHLAVGVRSAEVPPETYAACDLIVEGVPGVRELLALLVALVVKR